MTTNPHTRIPSLSPVGGGQAPLLPAALVASLVMPHFSVSSPIFLPSRMGEIWEKYGRTDGERAKLVAGGKAVWGCSGLKGDDRGALGLKGAGCCSGLYGIWYFCNCKKH